MAHRLQSVSCLRQSAEESTTSKDTHPVILCHESYWRSTTKGACLKVADFPCPHLSSIDQRSADSNSSDGSATCLGLRHRHHAASLPRLRLSQASQISWNGPPEKGNPIRVLLVHVQACHENGLIDQLAQTMIHNDGRTIGSGQSVISASRSAAYGLSPLPAQPPSRCHLYGT